MAFFKNEIAIIWTMFGWRTRLCTFISDSTLAWRRVAFLTLICFTPTSVPAHSPLYTVPKEPLPISIIFQYDLILFNHRQKTMAIFAGNWLMYLFWHQTMALFCLHASDGGTWGFQLVNQTDPDWLWWGLFFATVNLYEVASWWFYNKATAVVALFYLFPIKIPYIPCIRSEVAGRYDCNY